MNSIILLFLTAILTADFVSNSLILEDLVPYNVNNDVDDAIVKALEELRSDMATGVPDLGIPPLEPLDIEHLDFNINESLAAVRGFLDNLDVRGLSGFVVDGVSNDLEHLKASFGVTIPEIDIQGIYNVTGQVIGALDIFGTGPFTFNLTTLKTWGNVTIASEDGTRDSPVYIKELDIDFTLEQIHADFVNIMGGGTAGDAVNDIINENGVELVNTYRADFDSFISKTVIDFANKLLENYTLQEILDYLGVDTTP